MNCKECQDLILTSRSQEASGHIGTCQDCRSFLFFAEQLQKLEAGTAEAPPHIDFESLYGNMREKSPRIFFPKWAWAAAAAILLIISAVPFWSERTGLFTPSNSVKYLSQKITYEMEDIDRNIVDLEKSFLSADDVVDREIESLNQEIDILNQEVT
jgi:hypothetical protein